MQLSLLLSCFSYFKRYHPNMFYHIYSVLYSVLYYQFCAVIFSPVFLIGYLARRLYNPCTSATLGWYLFPECFRETAGEGWSMKSLLIFAAISLISSWILIDLVGGATIQEVETSYLQCACLSGYIKDLRHSLKRSELNDQDVIINYRQLQILEQIYNKIHQNDLIPIDLCLIFMDILIGLYMLLTLDSYTPIPHWIFFYAVFNIGIMNTALRFGTYGSVHLQSTLALKDLRERIQHMERRTQSERRNFVLLKMQIKSMCPLKIRIGTRNFVDKKTVVVILNFCVAKVAHLLLIQ